VKDRRQSLLAFRCVRFLVTVLGHCFFELLVDVGAKGDGDSISGEVFEDAGREDFNGLFGFERLEPLVRQIRNGGVRTLT
jgi:hypothetical protein